MSRFISNGAERHAVFWLAHPIESTPWVNPCVWVDPMSRPLLLYTLKLQNSHFLFCAIEVDPMSRLMCMSRPHESTHVHESTLWVDSCDGKTSQQLVFNLFWLYLILI